MAESPRADIPDLRDYKATTVRLRTYEADRGASSSVMSNIAEGFDRSGTGEFVQFLSIAKGSAAEVVSHLYVALDQKYIVGEEFDRVSALAMEVGNKIGALMR